MVGFYSCYSLLTDKHIESPIFKVSTPNFVKKQFSPIIWGFEGSLGLLGVFDPQFIIRQPSLQPPSYKGMPKLLASGESTKMMLEAVAEAWVKKIKQKHVFRNQNI